MNHDGTALRADQQTITVRHGYSRQDEVYETNKVKLDKNGIAKLVYDTPVNVTNTTALRIEVKLKTS